MNFQTLIQEIKTVPSTYSWNEGIPEHTYTGNLTNAVSSMSGDKVVFEGFSPYTKLSLFSNLTSVDQQNLVTVLRTVNFGDPYNSNSNILTVEGDGDTLFEHIYSMPGLYAITLTEITFLSSSGFGTYIESPNTDTVKNYVWQWKNFLSGSDFNVLNKEITWSNSTFQQPNSFTWREAKYPCLQFQDLNFTFLRVQKETITLSALLLVKEIPPVCYLSASQPEFFEERFSPLTVTLTPRYSKSGSFPIDTIIWDLGDDSEKIVKSRRDKNEYNKKFIFTNVLSGDTFDSKNYDITHIYIKTSESGHTFYPSISVFAGPTNTFNEAACVVGPLRQPLLSANSFKLLESSYPSFNEHVLVGQIDNNIGVWKLSST